MRPIGWRPRLVALDIDGTVVHGASPPTPRVRAAIDRAARHAEVMLCTGRTAVGVAPALEQLGMTRGTTLTSNGAVELDTATREVRTVVRFDVTDALGRLRERFPDARFACEHVGVGQRVSAPFPEGILAGRVTEVGLAALDGLAHLLVPGQHGRFSDGLGQLRDFDFDLCHELLRYL